MKIAIPCTDGDQVFQHFGHAEQFAIYEYEKGNDFVDKKVFHVKAKGHDQVARLLRHMQVNILVCGGIGDGALEALTRYLIPVYAGVEGNIDQAYYDLMENRLTCTSKPTCASRSCSCGSGGCSSCGCGT